MIGLLGCDTGFVRELISNPVYIAGTALRYAMLADELLLLLSNNNLSQSELTMLSALISSMRLKGLDASQLRCITVGSLSATRGEYLPLGICCSSTFFHNLTLSNQDQTVFNDNNVFTQNIFEIDFSTIVSNSSHKVVSVFNLRDGENKKPIQCFARAFRRGLNVVIYDRFFGPHSLAALEELLVDAHGAIGPLPGSLTLLYGRGFVDGLALAQVRNTLSQYYVNPLNVTIERTDKARPNVAHTHDRYIQIDDSTTFVLTAGLSAFYEANGLNRASQIFEMDLFVSYETLDLQVVGTATTITVKY